MLFSQQRPSCMGPNHQTYSNEYICDHSFFGEYLSKHQELTSRGQHMLFKHHISQQEYCIFHFTFTRTQINVLYYKKHSTSISALSLSCHHHTFSKKKRVNLPYLWAESLQFQKCVIIILGEEDRWMLSGACSFVFKVD